MSAFPEIPTWMQIAMWVAAAFVLGKYLCHYTGWLFYNKDKTWRENIERLWKYLSQHSYFEVMRDALGRLYDRLGNYFQVKKIRFLYLFLLFLLINLASLWLGKYWFGINPADVKKILSSLNELAPKFQLSTIDMMGDGMSLGRSLVSVFQLSLLDLYSFLFTMGIIRVASHSRNLILFLIELIIDISMLSLFFVLIFLCLHYWLIKAISLSLFGSFLWIFVISAIIWISYSAFMYEEPISLERMRLQQLFRPLFITLILPASVGYIMLIITPLTPSFRVLVEPISPFFILFGVFGAPIIIYGFAKVLKIIIEAWSARIFKTRLKDEVDSVVKFIMQVPGIIILLWYGVIHLIAYYHLLPQLYSIFSLALTSKFVLILVLSSALPTLAHLIAIVAAITAKATPKWLQGFINRHLDALVKHEDKILKQLGNAFGGLGALTTLVIKLI